MTRSYAEVIGDPIAHSKSPLIHNFWLSKLGIDAEYRATHVSAEELAVYFLERRADPRWRGCNVTIPHKIDVIRFADEVDETVANVGAANCLVPRGGKLVAYNTDVDGASLAIPGCQTPCCMIGAGGAARAAIPTLNTFMGLFDLRIVVREKAKAAASFPTDCGIEFFSFDEADRALRDAEAVINASPLGMSGQPPMPRSVLDAVRFTDPRSVVFDMVYSPLQTNLLTAARAAGRETVDGFVMLIGQAKAAFAHFYGQSPNGESEHDAQLRAVLTA